MPVSYKIDEPARIVFDRCWGVLTDAELAQHHRTLGGDPRFRPDFRELADFREVTELRVTGRLVRAEARGTLYAPQARRAFVMGSAEAFGVARMYALSLDKSAQLQLAVVRGIEEALEWLGLDPATAWPPGPPDAEFHLIESG